jgi:hypothetical protein
VIQGTSLIEIHEQALVEQRVEHPTAEGFDVASYIGLPGAM